MKVSVITTIYNTASYIKRCAQSLFEQTYKDIEYIFIDDASTDDSVKILKETIDNYPQLQENIKLLINEQNKGCSVSRAMCMNCATGEYIIHVDSDDYVAPNFIEAMACEVMHNDLDIVICDLCYMYGERHVIDRTKKSDSVEDCIKQILSGEVHGSLCNKLIRTSIIKDNNICPDSNVIIGEDKLVVLQVLSHAKKIGYVEEALYYYNRNTLHSTIKYKARLIPSFLHVTKRQLELFSSNSMSKKIYNGLQYYKALVLGHILLYSADLESCDLSLFDDVSISQVITQPVAPLHYKVIGVFYVLRLHFMVSILRKVVSIIKK